MESPTTLADRLFHAINGGDESLIRSLCAPTYRGFDASREATQHGRIALLGDLRRLTTAFPDGRITPMHAMTEGSSAQVVWVLSGTHKGTFLGIPATQREVEVCGFSHLEFAGGTLHRAMHLWDMAGLLRRLRLLPDLPNRRSATGLRNGMNNAFRTINYGTIPQPTT